MKKSLKTKAKRRILGGLVLFFCLFSFSVSPCFAMARRSQSATSVRNALSSFKQKIISIFTRDPVQPVYVSPHIGRPSVGTLNPSSGASNFDQPVIFSTTYTDPDGWQDIQVVYLLINTSTNGANCFWGYYDQNKNKLYLRYHTDTAWLMGAAPGSNKVIENYYAKLDCSKTTVSGTGKTLTVNWAVVFKAPFANKTYNSYLYVKDKQKEESGWVQKGTYRVDNVEISSFSPADGSRYIEGMTINCIIQPRPTNSQYQYQFLVDGQPKRAFSPTNAWNWQTTSQDIGIHTLTIQLKTQSGALIEKSRRLMIYRRPIEP